MKSICRLKYLYLLVMFFLLLGSTRLDSKGLALETHVTILEQATLASQELIEIMHAAMQYAYEAKEGLPQIFCRECRYTINFIDFCKTALVECIGVLTRVTLFAQAFNNPEISQKKIENFRQYLAQFKTCVQVGATNSSLAQFMVREYNASSHLIWTVCPECEDKLWTCDNECIQEMSVINSESILCNAL
ncbi:hypothetical protein FJ364_02975 [Candidatus Dependentiae bacterium]|nr:hypothetical protein [Candidatus Dependentiae bacterium]